MPSISVGTVLEYFYTDSGAPATRDYTTLIIIHGHSFHSGTFKRLLDPATSKSLRIICINRRGYPGTTPFSPGDLKVLASGTEEEKMRFIEQQGIDLAFLIDSLVYECHLPKNGGVFLTGWSMGNIFLLSLLASVMLLPVSVQKNLKASIEGFILWDPPSQGLGIIGPSDSYCPLWDEAIPLEGRGPAFAVWVSSYWKHGDLSNHDTSQLNYRYPEKSKKSTIESMTQEEVSSVMDPAAGAESDTFLVEPGFAQVLTKLAHKALFDSAVREAWTGKSVTQLYGESNIWCIIYANWLLQDMIKSAGLSEPVMNFKIIQGANHFVMWDDPQTALENLKACATTQTATREQSSLLSKLYSVLRGRFW